uniref:Uncharacterized protein n=1 Tax=Arundo donax TaxID=35708 RepID=A0A0A9ACY5_ARUDO
MPSRATASRPTGADRINLPHAPHKRPLCLAPSLARRSRVSRLALSAVARTSRTPQVTATSLRRPHGARRGRATA